MNFRQRASIDGVSVGGFRAGVSHGGLERLVFFFFLSRPRDAFASRYIFWAWVFVFTWEGVASGASDTWVAIHWLWGMVGGCHYCWLSSGRVT